MALKKVNPVGNKKVKCEDCKGEANGYYYIRCINIEWRKLCNKCGNKVAFEAYKPLPGIVKDGGAN